MAEEQHGHHKLKIYLHRFNSDQPPLSVDFHKRNTVEELIEIALSRWERQLGNDQRPSSSSSSTSGVDQTPLDSPTPEASDSENYELCEIMGTLDGQTCKERRLDRSEYPVAVQLLWPKCLPMDPNDESTNLTEYRFVLRQKSNGKAGQCGGDHSVIDNFLQTFFQQPKDKEYPDLCMLPELTEQTLLDNLRDRFNRGHIYTYIGPILVAVNPFKFFPIYNPKYAKLYDRRRLNDLPPHIFAIADAAYHAMLRRKRNQCIVISGESGSGKTESTNFLLHHLTSLSQKGAVATGIEQTLLAAGPVLEAFGNAVTAQNNNSSRFGKFIQVNYRENGMVYGANVQIYLLEKSRITSQPIGERNYHVFYYLLRGASDEEKREFMLQETDYYNFLAQKTHHENEGADERYEFSRLKQSMELVGFSQASQQKIFSVLSAVLLLGNIQYAKKSGYHSDDNAMMENPDAITPISHLLQTDEDKLLGALTTKRTVTKNDIVLTRYKVAEAVATRDAMAKCLYNALFDWIVLRINQALMKKDYMHNYVTGQAKGYHIGILDIFGFEDMGAQWNSFEQFCINYANERLQAYFNQHIFQFEQEEYLNQGLSWTSIEYTDNTECLRLMQGKPYGLFSLIDEECSVPKGTDETLLEKCNKYHKNHEYYETPHRKESAFIIAHYAGKVKYQITGFRDKNKDLMRQDVVNALKNSKSAFVRELVGTDPVAVFRWAIVRAVVRAVFAFKQAGRNLRKAASVQYLNVGTDSGLQRRSSESQLNALIRGEIDERKMPSFCDTSVFSTIIDHVRPRKGAAAECDKPLENRLRFLSASACMPQWNVRHVPICNRIPSSRSLVRQRVQNYEMFSNNNNCICRRCTADQCIGGRNQCNLQSIDPCTAVLKFASETLTLVRKGPFRHKRALAQGKDVRNLQALKAVAGKRLVTSRKTVGAQFQHSLGRLMESLDHANPFFIRCIRSNNDKIACYFDEHIILRQLRYTGMLETVRIRRAGYSVRLSYEEFSHQYRILLPHGQRTTKEDVIHFIHTHPVLDGHNVQFGHTKMFMRDAEKLLLDDQLHRIILLHILRLQSWFQTLLSRRRFLRCRRAAVKIQANVRGFLLRRSLQKEALAALCIQSYWRGHREASRYQRLRTVLVQLQAHCRGVIFRQKYQYAIMNGDPNIGSLATIIDERDPQMDTSAIEESAIGEKIGSPVQSDEGILTKASSRDDLQQSASPPGLRSLTTMRFRNSDSEESSGILENADFSDSEHPNQMSSHCRRMKLFQERSTSLDATFILEDRRLKLVRIEERFHQEDTPQLQRPRRPSLAPATSSANTSKAELRRVASSDHFLNARLSQEIAPDSDVDQLEGKLVSATTTNSSKPRLSVGGFGKAKRQLKAFLSRKAESFHLTESEEEEEVDVVVLPQKSPQVGKPLAQAAASAKAKSFSFVPGDHATFTALSPTGSQTHILKKFSSRLPNKGETCALCMKTVGGFLTHSFKCTACRLNFHKECSNFSSQFTCDPFPPSATLKPTKAWDVPPSKTWRRTVEVNKIVDIPEQPHVNKWSLTRTSRFNDPTDLIVGSFDELRQMSVFICKKIIDLKNKSIQQRDTAVDVIFREALQEFHAELLSHQASLKEDQIQIKYADLIASFQGALSKVCGRERVKFQLTVGVNGFRGYLNEFVGTKNKKEKIRAKEKLQSLRKKRRKSEPILLLGHRFKPDLVHVPTYCEVCNQFMWHSEKIYICLGCRISCHKKCHSRVVLPCTAGSESELNLCGRFFGADLISLIDDDHTMPIVLEKLLVAIEVRDLFAEGLYRKSASMAQVKRIRRQIEETPDFDQLSFDDIPVHLLATLVKAFFRELSDPLMTYDLYENFLVVADVADEKERLRCIYSMVELLPKANKSVLDRLMFHLARVAHHSEINKMSSNNLAVIFAPCLLKRQQVVKAQEQLDDCKRQTICITTLIDDKLKHYLLTLSDIMQLESAHERVEENLRLIDEHIVRQRGGSADSSAAYEIERARLLFMEQLDFLDQERDKLIEELPPLAPVASSEDDCLTSSDDNPDDTPCAHRRSGKDLKRQNSIDEYAIDMNIPPLFSNLVHLTKNRAPLPKGRRTPTSHNLMQEDE